jgi:hypothetical protein
MQSRSPLVLIAASALNRLNWSRTSSTPCGSLEDLSEQIARAVRHNAVEDTDVALRQAVEAGYPIDSTLPPNPRARNEIAPRVRLAALRENVADNNLSRPASQFTPSALLATSEPLRSSAIRP